MFVKISEKLRLSIRETEAGFSFFTQLHDGKHWYDATHSPTNPVSTLPANRVENNILYGAGDGYQWQTSFTPRAGGVQVETFFTVTEPVNLNPAMILWIDSLDNMNDRQAHTWRQTILRAPTTNQQGLPGNDLPACYLYDHATQTETICYYPPETFVWTENRFYNFTMREVLSYRPIPRYDHSTA